MRPKLSDRRARSLCVFASILTASWQCLAQEPPLFRNSTNLVLVSVTPRDSDGGFVRGLTPGDFTILEDGRPYKPEVLYYERVGETAPAGAVPPTDLPLLTSRETASRSSGLRLTVLFFDFATLEMDAARRAIETAEKYIEGSLTTADRVAVVSFGDRLRIEQDFTAQGPVLQAALKRIRNLNRDQILASNAADGDNLFQVDRQLDALRSIAQLLMTGPERKTLVYFSGGLGRIDNQLQLRSALTAMVRANLQIYPIDMRGLQATPAVGAADRPGVSGLAIYSGQALLANMGELTASRQIETALARETGGRAQFDSNDFVGALLRMQADTREYYVLGYRTENESRDGRFRRIDVRVAGAGVQVDHRRGYYAEMDFRHMRASDRARQLEDQLAAGLSHTDLPVSVWTGTFPAERERYLVPVSVMVPGSALSAGDGGARPPAVDLLAEVRDRDGRSLGDFKGSMQAAVAAGDISRLNLQYNSGFVLATGTYQLKVVVRENGEGLLGSFESTLIVPQFPADGAALSSVTLGAQMQLAAKTDPGRPLVWGDQELVPSVTRVFSTKQDLHVYFEIADPVSAGGAFKPASETVQVRLTKGDKVIVTAADADVSNRKLQGRGATAYYVRLPLDDLEAGVYVCDVTIHGTAVGAAASRRVEFAVKRAGYAAALDR